MPRVRLTARGWSAVAVFGSAGLAAALCARAALAAPGGADRRTSPAAVAGAPRPAETESRRRDEADAVQRQDAAEALKKHFNIDVDWRTTPLDRLIDIRVRAAKAAELQQRLGVSVDWQRYSWIELEALRRTLISFEHYRGDHPEPVPAPVAASPRQPAPGGPDTDSLVQPTFKLAPPAKGPPTKDPDGVLRPTFSGRTPVYGTRDPDGVLRPTFVGRPRWSTAEADPDGLISPTFAPYRRHSPAGDADGLIDPALGD
jgi:hypothetical protein